MENVKKRPMKDIDTERVGATGLRLTFATGKVLELDCASLPVPVQQSALVWGIREKLTNAAALESDKETGRKPSISDKIAAVERVFEMIQRVWSERAEGEGGGLLLKALCRANPEKPRAKLAEWLAKKTKKEQAALMVNEAIAVHIAAIRAEAASDVDSEELLSELDELA